MRVGSDYYYYYCPALQLSLKEMGERIAQRPKPVKKCRGESRGEFLSDRFFLVYEVTGDATCCN